MSIEKNKILFNRSYYGKATFYNNYLSSILAVNNYLTSVYFPDDASRMIYSSNDHAFRRRLKLQSTNNSDVSVFNIQSLNMPFMNFSVSSSGISDSTNRILKNNQLEKYGVMSWDINKKIKATPIQMEFEATYFSTEEIDIQYVMSSLQWDGALETLIKPEIEIDGETFYNYGNLDLSSINYRPQYNESDWLEQNKIRTISFNLTLDTYLLSIDDNNIEYWIPKKILSSFATSKNLKIHDLDNYDELLEGVIDHINEEVTF